MAKNENLASFLAHHQEKSEGNSLKRPIDAMVLAITVDQVLLDYPQVTEKIINLLKVIE